VTKWIKRGAFGAAVAVLVLSVTNASWLAPDPQGGPKLIAHRGVYQLYDKSGLGRQDCTATRIEEPVHDYLENTTRSMRMAQRLGAQMVEIDIAPTKDGEIAVFHDWTVDCRTQAQGDTRTFTMAELQALDIGYGYTADGGSTYPFRGSGAGQVPTLEEALRALPRTPIIYNFKSNNPAESDILAEQLAAAGRDVEQIGDAFYGGARPSERMAEIYPDAWVWHVESASQCSRDYVLYGWTSILPASCKGGTMIIPLNYQWAFWGWPNRLIARMEAGGGRVLVVGPYHDDAAPTGLALPEQLTEIPDSYNGWIWVEDIWTLGPALRPSQDRRPAALIEAANEGLDRRRERLGVL